MANYQNDLINSNTNSQASSNNVNRRTLLEVSYKCTDGEYVWYSANPCPAGQSAEMSGNSDIHMCENDNGKFYQIEECSNDEQPVENSAQYRCFNGDYYYYSSNPCIAGHGTDRETVDAEPTCYASSGLALTTKPALYEEDAADALTDDDEGNVPFIRDFDTSKDIDNLIDVDLWCPEASSKTSSKSGTTSTRGRFFFSKSSKSSDTEEESVKKCYDGDKVEYKSKCGRGETELEKSTMTKEKSEEIKGRMTSDMISQLDSFCSQHTADFKTQNKHAGSMGALTGSTIATISVLSAALVGIVGFTVFKHKKNQNATKA